MPYSIYLRDALLNHVFRATSYTAPATLYVTLLTQNPTDDTGAGLIEVTTSQWTSFARQAIASNTTNWAAVNGGATSPQFTSNNAVVSWGTVTINSSTIVTGFAIYDAGSSGNMMTWSALTGGNKTINNTDTVSFAAGALVIDQ